LNSRRTTISQPHAGKIQRAKVAKRAFQPTPMRNRVRVSVAADDRVDHSLRAGPALDLTADDRLHALASRVVLGHPYFRVDHPGRGAMCGRLDQSDA
jgi:hypothetical protein